MQTEGTSSKSGLLVFALLYASCAALVFATHSAIQGIPSGDPASDRSGLADVEVTMWLYVTIAATILVLATIVLMHGPSSRTRTNVFASACALVLLIAATATYFAHRKMLAMHQATNSSRE